MIDIYNQVKKFFERNGVLSSLPPPKVELGRYHCFIPPNKITVPKNFNRNALLEEMVHYFVYNSVKGIENPITLVAYVELLTKLIIDKMGEEVRNEIIESNLS